MWGLLSLPAVAAMVISDYRSRTVGIVPLCIFFITISFASAKETGLSCSLWNFASNLAVCLLLWGCLNTYFILRHKKLSDNLGAGDMVFIACMTPYFDMRNFMSFLVLSFILTLAVWTLTYKIRKNDTDIPLVTGLGVCLIIVISYKSFIGII